MKSPLNSRLRFVIIRTFALGTTLCGVTIIYNGMALHARAKEFKENLDAMAATIKELDKTITELRSEVGEFDEYLDTLSKSLNGTQSDIGRFNKESDELFMLIGTSTPKALSDSVTLLKNNAYAIKSIGDGLGQIPKDPFANIRSGIYSNAGTMVSMAGTLEAFSSSISAQAMQIREITNSSLKTAGTVLEASDGQIAMLKDGSLKRVPVIMESMSSQLNTHLNLIASSYSLVHQVTVPVIAVGFGFLFIGLWGLLLPFSVRRFYSCSVE